MTPFNPSSATDEPEPTSDAMQQPSTQENTSFSGATSSTQNPESAPAAGGLADNPHDLNGHADTMGEPFAHETEAPSSVPSAEPVSPVTSSFDSGNTTTQPAKPAGGHKWVLPVSMVVLVVLLLCAGYVFGVFLPNRPTAVYKSSMSRTADATDKLVKYMDAQAAAKYTGSSVSGTLNGTMNGVAFDGTFQGQTDGANATATLDTDIAGGKLNTQLRSIKVANSAFPDIYVKVSGLENYASLLSSGLATSLNNQWILVDHTLLATLQDSKTHSTASSVNVPTVSQLDDAAGKVQTVNRQYLFTDDTEKSVFTYDSFVGTETRDGQKVNHYQVSFNKTNLKAYASALGASLDSSSLNDWAKSQYNGKNISDVVNIPGLQKQIDSSQQTTPFDMYVNLKTKLVQSFQYAQKQDGGNGVDTIGISQLYSGSGTVYPFQINFATSGSKDSDMQGTVKLTTDTKTNNLQLTAEYKTLTKTNPSNVTVTFSATPTTNPLTMTAPSGAKSLNDVLQTIMGSSNGIPGANTGIPQTNILQNLPQNL